jgi:uncharacterized protein (TIGR03437 family)
MSQLFLRNALAVFALAFPIAALAQTTGTPTLTAGSTLSLNTGVIGSGSSGDVLWSGTSFTLQGSATGVDLASTPIASAFSGSAGYNELVQEGSTLISTFSTEFGSYLTTSPITPNVNDILVVLTNGGNYALVLVTAISGTSITLEFETFTGSTTTTPPSGPTITGLANNYSGIPAGLPSYGIAPASLFIIYGSDLSNAGTPVLQSSAAPGLPLTLNGTSISVTVNGITTSPAIYYTSPTQVAAVLPSTTPAGTGTIIVTYNGTPSSPFTILVTKSAFGIDTLYGTGSGGIVATVGSTVITPTDSASPGQTITIWGSGLGADTANNDRTYPMKQDNLGDAAVYIGGFKATVTYAGRSQYPGVDQVNVVVPSQLTGGCSNAVVVVAHNIDSNFGGLPVNPGGGVCVDAIYGINGTQLSETGSQGTVKAGSLTLFQSTLPSSDFGALKAHAQPFTTVYTAGGFFSSTTGFSYVGGSSFLSLGSCIIILPSNVTVTGGTSNGLDAGPSIGLAGGDLSTSLTEVATSGPGVGDYESELKTPLQGGTAYTFTGTGGKDVGPFKGTITFPVPLDWTNESSITTVTESGGQLITWTGGANGTYVYIEGSSSTSPATGEPVSISFVCIVPVTDQQFTIPAYVLLALPTGTGTLAVFNEANPVSFIATGITSGSLSAGVASEENVTYQ